MENKEQTPQLNTSYSEILAKMNQLIGQYTAPLGTQGVYDAFARASFNMANNAPLQNARVKGISPLPCDYTKEELGDFLRNPYQSEAPLRQVSETLKWTAYPFFKTGKTYQDIATYRHYVKPQYVEDSDFESKDWLREAVLLDKFCKAFRPEVFAHEATGKALWQGKVFYTYRYELDKPHNKVRSAFWQQLPSEYCTIIGKNNISGWTVSFNMMYFMNFGTDPLQYGDLFKPYLDDFNAMFSPPKTERVAKVVYASKGNKKVEFYPQNVNPDAIGNPRVFMQNGTYFYWVSLPVDKVWTFEIDDTTANVASPFAGLMLTYANQSDYEQAQLSLLLNPLIKIFTGEIPYFNDNGATVEDGFRLSIGGRTLFETFFDQLMARNQTAGTAIYSAPLQNIKSHDYPESANANKISQSFVQYATSKSGLAGLIPVGDEIKASQVEVSKLIESRFATATIYPQVEKMINYIFSQMGLRYEWQFKMFGTIFDESTIYEQAKTALSNGDISAWFILSALTGDSWIDKICQMKAIKSSKLLDMLTPPPTAYTQSNSGGRPQTKNVSSDAKEKSIDEE